MAPRSLPFASLLLVALAASACAAPAEEDVGDTSGAASKGSSSSDPMNQPVTSRYYGMIRDAAKKPLDGVDVVVGCPSLAKPTLGSAEDTSANGGDYTSSSRLRRSPPARPSS